MIRAGSISLLGLGMGHLAPLRAAAEGAPRGRAKSVIYIFLSGGLSQHESFDPKPDAPMEVRGDFKPVRTRTPGLHICEHLPELAKRSHLWALCRSLTHGSNDHSQGHHIMLTGRSDIPAGFDPGKPTSSDWPSIASLVTTTVPPRNNLPPAIVLPEKLVHRTGRVIPGQFSGSQGRRGEPWFVEYSRFHPETYGAHPEYLFHHENGAQTDAGLAFVSPNLSLPEGLSGGRFRDRLALVSDLDRQRRELAFSAEVSAFEESTRKAVSLLTGGKVAGAFDVSRAPEKLQERYGRNSFGWSLLLASRLVQAGVSLVQVNLGNNESWDTHQSIFPNLKNFLLPPMDKAVSALLDDLQSRGLLEETLVVMASEFGRTPRISTLPGGKRLPGRDHWGAVQSVFFAGGGVRGGTVIGSSDKIGGHPASDAQTPENFAATIYSALGIPAQAAWTDLQSRPHPLYQGQPMSGLFG